MTEDTEILNAITAVLNGNPTKQEQEIVDKWLKSNEKNRSILDNLFNTSYIDSIKNEAYDSKENIYSDISYRIEKNKSRRTINIWKYIAAASIMISIILLGAYFYKYKDASPVTIAQIQTKTPNGLTSNILLGDGTTVRLNAGSELSYPAVFNGNERNVTLKGEAYFEVARDETHPFIVETNDIKIKVLGTSFNIKSYEDDEKVITTLLEGSISVENKNSSTKNESDLILEPNQQLVFDKKDKTLNIREVNSTLFVIWKDGQYYFEGEKFSDIVKKLERGFGININIKSPELNNLVFSGVFNKTETIDQILNSFKKNRRFVYVKNDTEITIYSK
jgi:ferric-dicitrate binding protein FerR (iron transport regulator)